MTCTVGAQWRNVHKFVYITEAVYCALAHNHNSHTFTHAGVWEQLWEEVSKSLEIWNPWKDVLFNPLKVWIYQVLWRAKKFEIRLKSELSHSCTCMYHNTVSLSTHFLHTYATQAHAQTQARTHYTHTHHLKTHVYIHVWSHVRRWCIMCYMATNMGKDVSDILQVSSSNFNYWCLFKFPELCFSFVSLE